MSQVRRPIKTEINPNLLTMLQAGVSESRRQSEEGRHDLSGRIHHPASHGPLEPEPLGSPRPRGDRPDWRTLGVQKRQVRTTLSMPVEVGNRARRLTMALTLLEERDVSLGTAVGRALDLLEEELRSRGARIPEQAIELRTGKRHV